MNRGNGGSGRAIKSEFGAAMAIVALACICASLYLYNENRLARSELNQKSGDLDSALENISFLKTQLWLRDKTMIGKDADISALRGALNDTSMKLNRTENGLRDLEAELNETSRELEDKSLSLDSARMEFENLSGEIYDVRQSLSDSIGWFKDNSELPQSLSYFVPYVRERCVADRRLNLACVSLMMERRLGFRYISESPDRLYSIDEMVMRNGGDCEDYSLFLKALINSMKGSSGSLGLLSWQEGAGKFMVFSTDEADWYYQGSGRELGRMDEAYPQAICYVTSAMYERVEGHCIIALSESPVTSAADLADLDGALTFDPQDGRCMGRIGDAFHACQDGEIHCGEDAGEIIIVISDDDLYQFRDGGWTNFSLLDEQAAALIEKIDGAMEK